MAKGYGHACPAISPGGIGRIEDLRHLQGVPHGAGHLGGECEGREGMEDLCLEVSWDGTAYQPKERGHRQP